MSIQQLVENLNGGEGGITSPGLNLTGRAYARETLITFDNISGNQWSMTEF